MPIDNKQDWIIQFFEFAHLPEHLQDVSRPFCDHAHYIVKRYPQNPERTVALRKLLEAKDALVRCALAEGSIGPRDSVSVEDVLSESDKRELK